MKRPCTVEQYLAVLTSKLVQLDVKLMAGEQRRGGRGNLYRMGHWLTAKEKVEQAVASVRTRGDAPALLKLQRALHTHFESDFPPLKNVERQIRSGKCSLVRK
jgi:hypothetical protein